MWSDLILSYTKSKAVYSISVAELYASPICMNSEINRRLSLDSIHDVLAWMEKNKFAEYTSASKDRVFVYWRSI